MGGLSLSITRVLSVFVLVTLFGLGVLAARNAAFAGGSCPQHDDAGYALGEHREVAAGLFCSYPSYSAEDPLYFYCLYSRETHLLIQDQDAGFCPIEIGNPQVDRDDELLAVVE